MILGTQQRCVIDNRRDGALEIRQRCGNTMRSGARQQRGVVMVVVAPFLIAQRSGDADASQRHSQACVVSKEHGGHGAQRECQETLGNVDRVKRQEVGAPTTRSGGGCEE